MVEMLSGEYSRRTNADRAYLGIVVVLTFLLYLGSLPKEFTNWDDGEYITGNSIIRSLSLKNLEKIVTEPYFANYAPLTLISYAVDYHFWRLNPTAFHFHNVALHLGCVVVLFFLLIRLGLSRETVWAVTLLFALHPINVESVSWASERKNLLATFFFFLSFYHYVQFSRVRSGTHYLSSLLFFQLSIMSKASTIVAPLAFVLYDYCKEEGRKVRQLKLYDKLPFIVLAEVFAFLAVHAAGSGSALNSYHRGGAFVSLLASGHLFREYIQILLWPTHLSALIYPTITPSCDSVAIWIALLSCLAVMVALFLRSKVLFFWFAFFVIFLIPVLNIVPLPIMMANRYLYISQVGVWVILSVFVLNLVKLLGPYRLAQGVVWASISVWLFFLGYQTFQSTKVWRNSYTLWTDTIEKNFFDGVAHYNLGLWFHDQKQSNRSGHEYFISLLINPGYHLALAGIGGHYFEKGQINLSLQKFYTAVNAAPDSDVCINNLGKVLAEKGDARRALYMFFRATYVNPKNIEAFNNIVVLYLRVNRVDAALEIARSMTEGFPDVSDGYFRLGMCLEAKGDLVGALNAWEEGKKLVNTESQLNTQIDAAILSARERLSVKAQPSIERHGS
jgi:tetratricopeptide (TPR) repeat protein